MPPTIWGYTPYINRRGKIKFSPVDLKFTPEKKWNKISVEVAKYPDHLDKNDLF